MSLLVKDKVTLKLFEAALRAGKVERALDLMERLHSELALDLAMKFADRANHSRLADRIEQKKAQKFPLEEEQFETPEEDFDDAQNYLPSQDQSDFHDDPAHQRITPPSARISKRSFDDLSPTSDDENDEAPKKVRKRMNPFAKKRLESPAKPSNLPQSPGRSPNKIELSRKSSFSAQSREQTKGTRNIM
jgi:hypothetical protein